ncbi:MAG: mechanosensitive ion channel family protein, partial [Deltaproteobacteria bacterium]|nr:mechanosensitive ion channel family protein [Deltaproteobacteria bacterium]
MNELSEQLVETAADYGPDLLGAAVILILGWWVASLASRLVRRMMTRAEIAGTLVGFAANLTYMAAIVFV